MGVAGARGSVQGRLGPRSHGRVRRKLFCQKLSLRRLDPARLGGIQITGEPRRVLRRDGGVPRRRVRVRAGRLQPGTDIVWAIRRERRSRVRG